jgi:hypothetical protein
MICRTIGLFATAVVLPLALGLAGCSHSSQRISGGGATFVNPIMQKWSGEYKRAKNVEIDYVAKGSGYGIEQMTARTIDFGCTDAPLTAEQVAAARQKGGDVVHIPLTMGAVAVVYNVPEVAGHRLRLTGEVLADIYRRDPSVQKWNAPRIAELNPGVALPDTDIVVVARAEKSGEHLQRVSGQVQPGVCPAGGGEYQAELAQRNCWSGGQRWGGGVCEEQPRDPWLRRSRVRHQERIADALAAEPGGRMDRTADGSRDHRRRARHATAAHDRAVLAP